MKEILTIFNYIDGENDELFYSSAEPIKLYEYSFSSQRMGSSSITASFAYPFVLDDAWDGNQYVSFRGRKYFLRNKPTSSKDNTDARYNYNVEFIPKIEIQLSNVYFYDAVVLDAETDDKYKSNSTKVIFYGTLDEFVARLNASLQYSGLSDYTVVIDGGIVTEAKQVSFENKTFFEALQDSYELWNVPFYFVGENEIHFGEASTEIETVFKYGVNNSLLSIKKVNADYQIINRCTGSGSSENIPYYYPNNSPKGNISAAALSSNIKLSQENIHIKDYEKFSANIEPSDTVYWRSSVVYSRVVTVNGEEQYSGQERQVNIVNMQPVVDVFTVNFAMASDGRAVISTNTVRNGMDIGSALSRGIITKYTLTSVENPLSYNTVSDNGDGTLITSWLDAGAYTLTLEYTLAYVGVINYTYSTDIALSGKTEWSVSRDGNGTPIELSDIGISVDISPANGDGFTQNLLSKIAPSSSLQPPIYRESLGAERFYNAENNKYTNPDTGEFYQFENEYTNNNPREYITENEDIKPTIKGITNAAGQEIGRFLDVAYDTNDNDETDEEGNYLHPYFFVKLPKFNGAWGFNLFDHAIESGEMTIAMTSGNCAPCKFIIGVSDDDIQRNLVQVDSNGGLLRDEDGDVRCGREGKPGETPQPRQNDTENYEVWIALKKDTSTFGVIMPNAENNYKPLTGDSFVILNISLPQAYIDKAEENLKDFIIRYMADNNSDKFDFSIEFSRIYIAEHPEIAAALDENSKLKIEYNGKTYSFFVSQYTYRANNEEALPEIKVELSDSISIEKGTIERTVNQIELNANKQVLNIDFLGYGRSYFLGKNYNDTASGIITFLRGLIIGEQRSGYGFAIKDKSVVGVLGALTLGAKKNKTSLDLQTGHIEGFRTGLRRITEDATLTASDYLVLVENPENSTIKLPANPEDGQAYRIHNAGFSQIIIDGNGNLITRSGKPAGTQAVNNGETAIIEIFFSSIVNQWYMSYSSESFFAKDADGNIYVKDGRGFYSNSFVSSRGTDDEAGGGSGTGLDVDTLWQVLGSATSEQINATHIPSLSISKITGLQDALDAKLEGITKGMVEAVLTGTVTSHNHDGRYAPLSGGLIPSQHLPSYVDDVLEYASMTAFPATGEAGKIYVALDTNLTYRWGGSSYVEISPSLALGHTSSTAYPGDEGAANASAILALQGLFTNGAANRVAHALTFSYSGGASETYDGSSAVTVTVPTAEQMSLWDRICALFGIDADGHVYVTGNRGFYGNSFVSSRGSDPESGGGSGQGIDEEAMWTILGTSGTEKIDATHIPALPISQITGLQGALASKLEGITAQMVVAALGYTPYDAAAISAASVAYASSSGTAGKVSQKLTVKNDGGSSSASAKTFDGSAAVTVTIPTTLPASDVYAWAKAATKPSYTWSEIGGKPSAFTPAAHKHVKADITDFPTSWAWSAITGRPTTLAGYGITDGVNSAKASGGLSAAVDGHVLTIGVASGYAVPTSAQISAWNLVASLFGVDSDGNVYVKGNRGFYGTSFLSARGSDPESGSSGSGLDEEAMWDILGTSGTETIDATHIPALPISQITGLQGALASKLEGITAQMVVAALGYTPYDAAAISAASVAYASSSGTAGKVSQKLTVKNDGGSSSASAKTFDGSAAVTVTIPTTLPASDVYAWAKAATKPSYTWSEIGGKPSAFTPAAHKHVKADITDFPTSWAWSAITGRPTTLAGYGITDGVNSAKASGGLSAAVDGHVLTIGVASGYAVPTSAQISAWNLVASLFGVDSDGNVYVKGNRGFYGTSFLSARGSDPESGSSGSGLDEEAMWDILGTSGTETIDASHIPSLSALSGQLTNAQLAYDSISVAGVKVALGGSVSTAQIASALTAAGYKLTDTVTTLASLGITATAAELNRLDGITASTAELNCLDGISGPVQTQLNAKQATITGAATSIVSSNLTANRALVSSSGGKVAVSAVSATELGYLDGVTSNIQAQLNGKANTSALSAYLPLAGGTMTGNLTARNIILPNGYVLYSVEGESGGGMLRFRNGRTILGSIGASTTAATHIRSITGHITTGSSDAATYNVLDTGNYTSYTVTKTGGGASGTWRINISGNAGRAAYLTSTYTGSGGLQPPSYFNGMGLKVNMMSKPVVYSDVVVVNGYNGIGSDVPYINAIGFQKTSGDHGEVYHARGDYGGDSWGTWHKFLDEYNYTSYAVSLTGAQTISGAKTFSSPVTAPALTYSRKYVTRCNSVGWYRCFSFSLNNASCPTAILHVSRIYNTSDGESYVFAISLGYDGKVSITQLSGTAGKRIITKIRVAYVNSSTAYVDFYYSLSYSSGNEVYVSSSGYGVSQAPAQVNDTTSSFYEFETADGCKSDTYVTAGQYVYSPKGLFGLTEAQADSYAGSGYYKLAVGQQSPRKGASLLLYRDSTSYQSYIGWSTGSADHVVIGLANGTNDLGITNKKGAIKLTGQGTLTYNNYTVWHAGNDGAGSGLDADLLDGTQKSGLLTSAASTPATNLSVTVGGTTKSVAGLYATYLGGFPATAFDLSTNLGTCQDYGCYVIGLMQITDYTTSGNHANGELILIRQNGNNPAQKIIYSLSTMHSSTNVRFGYLLFSTNSFVMPCTFTHNGKKWAGFNVTTASSYTNGVVCKRDGLRLGERSTPFLLKYKVSNTGQILNSEVNDSLVVNGSDIIECGVSARSFIGALSGNASSATKLATARSLWGQPFDGSGNVSGDMTGVGNISMSGGINSRVYVGSGDDLSRIGFRSHKVEFKGHGYLHMGYYFRPGYGSSGETQAAVYIQNASASNSPVFTTTHAFENNGNAAHTGSLTAGSTITSGAHLFMKAATGRFVFNAAGSGFMMSMENGNFRLMSHNNTSYVSRLVEVDMSGNVGIKSTPASGYALTVAGAGYFSGALSLSRAGSVGLLVDTSFRNLSWTVDTSGGWARSLKATDPTGSTTLINAVGVFGAGQTPEYVYLGGTSYASPSMAITAAGNVGIGTTSPGYRLDVRGTGYFSGVLGANGLTLPYGGATWISMASTPAVLQGAMNQSTVSAHPLFRVKNSAGDAIVFGGLGSKTGFYGFTAERISSGSNSYDWATTWNVGTGHLTHNGAMTVGGLLTASAGLTTPQYVQVGSGRLKWDASANALYVEKSDGTACGLYATSFLSARGSDPESGSSELVPVVTLSKLTVGTRVSISVLDNAGLTADVREKMCDGTIGRVKAVFSDGSTEIWPVLHASEGFISFGYDTVAGGYQDTMNIYEITIPSKTTVIRVEHFER